MTLMRLTHIEKRLERLMTSRSKRRTAIPQGGTVATASRKIKIRKRKATRL
jgi:hypothetical protein